MWRKKCGQWALGTAGGGSIRQSWMGTSGLWQGATMAEKLRETKVWVPASGRKHHASSQRLGLGAGGGRPSRCEGPAVSHPENF